MGSNADQNDDLKATSMDKDLPAGEFPTLLAGNLFRKRKNLLKSYRVFFPTTR